MTTARQKMLDAAAKHERDGRHGHAATVRAMIAQNDERGHWDMLDAAFAAPDGPAFCSCDPLTKVCSCTPYTRQRKDTTEMTDEKDPADVARGEMIEARRAMSSTPTGSAAHADERDEREDEQTSDDPEIERQRMIERRKRMSGGQR